MVPSSFDWMPATYDTVYYSQDDLIHSETKNITSNNHCVVRDDVILCVCIDTLRKYSMTKQSLR